MIVKDKDTSAAVEFISKNGKRIKDFEAKISFIKNNEVIVKSKFFIKNILAFFSFY